jgi:sugar phosphate isomerase/epimerase
MAEMGLNFLDFTIEPPAAASWRINPAEVRKELDRHGMKVVGHTAFYLPLASAFEGVRRAAVDEFVRCLNLFSEVGAKWMNLHPDRHAPMHDRSFYIGRNLESLAELQRHSERAGVGLMVENLPGDFNDAHQLGELLDPMPQLGLHLDIGHANLMVLRNTTEEILRAHGKRLRHVHLHDNKGGHADLHLPLGAGNLNLYRELRALKECGFDETITLEVFTPDRHYLAYSRDVLRKLWNEIHLNKPEPQPALAAS